MISETIFTLVLISLAVSSMSMTVSQTAMFRPFRLRLYARSRFIGKLVSCPYCLSHWLAFGFVGWSGCFQGVLGFILASFAVVTLASFSSLVIAWFLEEIDR